MEQPPRQCFQRVRRVGQFLGLQRSRDRARMVPFRRVVADVQAIAPNLALGQMLKQQATRDAARLGIVPRGEPNQTRNLSDCSK